MQLAVVGFDLRHMNSVDGFIEFLKLIRIVVRKRGAENMDVETKMLRIQEWEANVKV